MAVYDRWHTAALTGDAQPCREHGKPPARGHGSGLRWQVRWRDDEGRQRKRSFARKDGRDPSRHADAFDAKVTRDLDTGDYIDPDSANVTFRAYAEEWRRSRTHDVTSATRLEQLFRLHVYPVIGARSLRELSRRPSLTQAWIKGMDYLAPSTARQIVIDVSGVYIAAMNDGLIGANPTRAGSVTRPKAPPRKPRAWTAERVAAMTAALPGRYQVIPLAGAGTGMRQGELFGLAVGDIAFLGRDPKIRVLRQIKHVAGVVHFAPPKRRKTREVPLAPEVAEALARHLELFPAVTVTLPWHDPSDRARHGRPVTVRLVVSNPKGRPADHRVFNRRVWNEARKRAGVPLGREDGMHALRHTFASAQLGAGVPVLSVATWMGDTAAVVLGTYAHFMPGREDGGRAAVSAFFAPGKDGEDGSSAARL